VIQKRPQNTFFYLTDFFVLAFQTNSDIQLKPYICSVKNVLKLLFSFYLLALVYMPCSDKDDCKYTSTDQSTFTTTDHSSHDNDTESCYPFCMCTCCGQSCSFTYFQSELGLYFPSVSQKVKIYKVSFSSDVYFSIWQPPKIS